MGEKKTLTFEDLQKESGLPTRTLRFYKSAGLLPGAVRRGRNAVYDYDVLDRIHEIIKHRENGLSLDEIAVELGVKSNSTWDEPIKVDLTRVVICDGIEMLIDRSKPSKVQNILNKVNKIRLVLEEDDNA